MPGTSSTRPVCSKPHPAWPGNASREGAATASLGNLFQCLTTLMVKNFFLIFDLNLPSFSLKPLPLVLSLRALVKSPSPAFLYVPFRYWKAAEQPQLSQPFLTGEVFHPSDHFCGRPLDKVIFSMSLISAETFWFILAMNICRFPFTLHLYSSQRISSLQCVLSYNEPDTPFVL